jgi:hypothetical protein
MKDSFVSNQCLKTLETAKDRLRAEDTVTAILLVDRALELFLKESCVFDGCDEESVLKDHSGRAKPFDRWSFTDYIRYLDSKGRVSKTMKADFFQFHGWRNSTEHVGIEPSSRQVSQVVTVVEQYFEQELKDRPEATLPETLDKGSRDEAIIEQIQIGNLRNASFEQPEPSPRIDLLSEDTKQLSGFTDVKDFESKIRHCDPENINQVRELDGRVRSIEPGIEYYSSGNDLRYTHRDIPPLSEWRRNPFVHVVPRKRSLIVHVDKDVVDPKGITRRRNANSRFLKQFAIMPTSRLTSYHVDLIRQSLQIVKMIRV